MTQNLLKKVELFIPVNYGEQPCSYKEADKDLVNSVTGGCGPGGIGDLLVPDTLYLLSVKPACSIHDWMYNFGLTLMDKDYADQVFLNNMVKIVRTKTKGRFLKFLRLRRARIYYKAVRDFGGSAFWESGVAAEELMEVEV